MSAIPMRRASCPAPPGNAFQPVFSFDGRWLAFLRQQWQGYGVSSQLWLAQADGSAAHAISPMGGITVDGFQWSPTADVLAVQSISAKGRPLSIRLMPVQGPAHDVPDHLQGSFLWSPDGQTLAVAATSRSGYTRLDLVRGNAVTSYALPGVGRYNPFRLAGWWPNDHSILIWMDPGGCYSCIADGTKLDDYDLQTGTVRHVGVTLPYHRDWVVISGDRLLVVMGRDRSAFYGKRLQLCLAAGPCHPLLQTGAHRISLDPAWAPDGAQMAFVVAPAWKTWGFLSGRRYEHWLDAHVLWTARPGGSGAKPAGGVPKGAQGPEWTHDGRGILFVKDGALWLDPHFGAANAHPIARLVSAHPLPGRERPAYQNSYYGHMNWHDLFAWY
jgi:Tol biopolymer transport system component